MSMNCYALEVAPAELAKLKRDPAEASALTQARTLARVAAPYKNFKGIPDYDAMVKTGAPDSASNRKAWERYRRDITRAIESLRKTAAAASRQRSRGHLLDLHKSWHVLHYLFTGEANAGGPPANALLGGRELGEDVGYGPPRLRDPAATSAFARFLAPLTVAELQRRIDIRRMRALGIYCCDAGDAGSAEEVGGDVAHYFPRLQKFVAKAADNGSGLLVWLS
jgi:hypothetical protein